MLNAVLIGCGITLLVLTILVVYSNYRSSNNQWLGGFLISGFLWLLANLLANNATSNTANLYFSRLTLIGAALVPLTFLMFCYAYTNRLEKLSHQKFALIVLPIFLLLLTTPTSLNVKSANSSGIQPGIAYFVLLAVILVYFSIGIKLLVSEYKQSQELRKRQLYFILLGTFLTVLPGFILNGALPLFGVSKAVFFGPSVVIFFSVFTSIAIVRHKLFDIRLVIARSLGYIGSVLLISIVYGTVVFGLARYAFNLHFSFAEESFFALLTALATLSFSKIQGLFARITNSLFYRDAYDAQSFFDRFNKALVTTYDLPLLLRKTSTIIETNLKPAYCLFGIKESGNTPRRIIGTKGHPEFRNSDIDYIRSLTPHMNRKVIVTDELEEDYADLQKMLRLNNVSIIARLATSNTKEGLGYLVLGPKKSGNLYRKQDINVIEIIANELVVAVQNALHTEEIENFNITLQQKVVDATNRLRATNEKLKALDEAKDDFVSMASHQLRTPLTSVKGNISMVLDGDAGNISGDQKQLLDQAYSSSQRMVFLISDLLNVSRLKTGKFVIEKVEVDLANVVEDEVNQLQDGAKSRHLTLNYEKPEHITPLMLDDTKTRQVIMNFIDNAIYYTPSGGTINVVLSETPTVVECKVIDNGIGVPKHEQHHLFTKFYRAGNARKARPDGTGLGLFMAKKVIVSEGGTLIFETEEGKGSTFGFSFPKKALEVNLQNSVAPTKQHATVS